MTNGDRRQVMREAKRLYDELGAGELPGASVAEELGPRPIGRALESLLDGDGVTAAAARLGDAFWEGMRLDD